MQGRQERMILASGGSSTWYISLIGKDHMTGIETFQMSNELSKPVKKWLQALWNIDVQLSRFTYELGGVGFQGQGKGSC